MTWHGNPWPWCSMHHEDTQQPLGGQQLLACTSPKGKSITTLGWSNRTALTQSHAQSLAASPGGAPHLALTPCRLPVPQAACGLFRCTCKGRRQPTDSHWLSFGNAASSPCAVSGHRVKNTATSPPWGIVIPRHRKSRDPTGNEGGSISKLIK